MSTQNLFLAHPLGNLAWCGGPRGYYHHCVMLYHYPYDQGKYFTSNAHVSFSPDGMFAPICSNCQICQTHGAKMTKCLLRTRLRHIRLIIWLSVAVVLVAIITLVLHFDVVLEVKAISLAALM
jgi:hypothetical protein